MGTTGAWHPPNEHHLWQLRILRFSILTGTRKLILYNKWHPQFQTQALHHNITSESHLTLATLYEYFQKKNESDQSEKLSATVQKQTLCCYCQTGGSISLHVGSNQKVFQSFKIMHYYSYLERPLEKVLKIQFLSLLPPTILLSLRAMRPNINVQSRKMGGKATEKTYYNIQLK